MTAQVDEHPHTAVDHIFGVGRGIAATVYGTVMAMATVTAFGNEKDPAKLAVLVASTAFVLWLAHLYAHALSESIVEGMPLRLGEVGSIARRELGILLAAVLPVTALVLGALDVLRESSAVWLAIAIGLVTLGVEGARYARLEALGPMRTMIAVGLNLALGVVVVALKVAVSH